MSTSRHHAEWLSLTPTSGPFLSMPVLLRAFPQGLEPHDPHHTRNLRAAFEQWEDDQECPRPDTGIHRGWIAYVLRETLRFPDEVIAEGQSIPEGVKATIAEHGEVLRPDLMVVNPNGDVAEGKPRLLVQMYPRRQGLEKALEGARWKASPAARMTELLHGSGVRLGLITNGEHWMLVDAPVGETSGYASWYASLWQEEPLTLRAFRSLLSVQRFFGVADGDTLESLLAESASDQQEVTDQLGYQVRRAVEVLVHAIDRIDKDRNRNLLNGVNEKDLYQAALTVMMRLVILFSAEERGLLLLGDALYDQNYAVSTLRAQLRVAADQSGEEILERRNDAWSRLLATFRAVFGGVQHEAMRLPAYGGSLFDPDRFPFLEGRAANEDWRSAHPLPVNNRTVLHLLEALQVLQVKVPGGGPAEARLLSFRALDIEQIGHVYEGLLDHTAVRAEEPVLGLVGTRNKEPEISVSRLEAICAKGEKAMVEFLKEHTGRSVNVLQKALATAPTPSSSSTDVSLDLFAAPVLEPGGQNVKTVEGLMPACDNDTTLFNRILPFSNLLRRDTAGHPVVITTGSVYVTEGTDRRSTGTHYTPQSLTKPIVQRTLEPLVYRDFAKGTNAAPETLRTPAEILALKVCDMTTGSGAFLVQACRYLSERLVEAWEAAEKANPGAVHITPEGEVSHGHPTERLIPADPDERLAIARRLVADRCLYGVDKNPMAVEMAKLSLWLITMQKDRPFTFLDHAIKSGDSLVGVDMAQLRSWSLDRTGKHTLDLWMERGISLAIDLRKKLLAMPETNVDDVREKERLYREAERAMGHVRLAADLLIAPSFKYTKPQEQKKERDSLRDYFLTLGADGDDCFMRAKADLMLAGQHTFHWPLEFPEVFLAPDRNGFDALVGNPPFQGGQKITGLLGVPYREYLVQMLGMGKKGSADIVAYFYLRAFELTRWGGVFGMIATNTIAQGDTREVGLEQIVAHGGTIVSAIRSMKWPGTANLEVSVAHVYRKHKDKQVFLQVYVGEWQANCLLDDNIVTRITPYLDDGAASGKPVRLRANAFKSFQGSIVLGMGFIMEPQEAQHLIQKNPRNKDVLFAYLNGEDLNSRPDQSPSRWVINFGNRTLQEAEQYPDCMAVVRDKVLPERQRNNRAIYRDKWWQYAEKRRDLYLAIDGLERVLACPVFTKYLSFSWLPPGIVYMNKMYIFPFDDEPTFCLLHSSLHEAWARLYSATLETRLQYTPTDCFETYPFPRWLDPQRVALQGIGLAYHTHRSELMLRRAIGMTKAYNLFHDPFCHDADIMKFRTLHIEMDTAICNAYGWDDLILGHAFYGEGKETRYTLSPVAKQEVLRRLLTLNHQRATEEAENSTSAAPVAAKSSPRRKSPNAQNQIAMDDLSEVPAVQPPRSSQPSAEEVEAAIKTLLVCRHGDPDMLERLRSSPLKKRPWPTTPKPLHRIRLMKQVYGAQQIAKVPSNLGFVRAPRGPLSTTFYQSEDVARNRGWLIIHDAGREDEAVEYLLGPKAEEAVKMALAILGERDQALDDMLFYLDEDSTHFAEQWMTVHMAWEDARAKGTKGSVEDVVREVEDWKPDRKGFNLGSVRQIYADLKARGYVK